MSSLTPEPDEIEQSSEEQAPSGQEVPPVAEPEQREGTAANRLDDPQVRYNLHISMYVLTQKIVVLVFDFD